MVLRLYVCGEKRRGLRSRALCPLFHRSTQYNTAVRRKPSKHAGSYPEVFWLRPVMAITASVLPELGRIVHAGSDFPHPFQLRFFQRRHGSYCAKLTRIRSGWPGQGLAKRVWSGSKPVCRNHRARFLAGRNRPATSFPL